jgi:hypothetical protein
MADKTIGGLTAATTIAAGDLLIIENASGNSRKVTGRNARVTFGGALVKKAADQTGANFSVASKVPWDTVVFDTDSVFVNADDNFVIPAAWNGLYAQIGGTIGYTATTAGSDITLSVIKTPIGTGVRTLDYDGAGWNGFDGLGIGSAIQAQTGPVLLTTGDKWDLQYLNADTSTDITATRSHFWLKLL